jgi:hypothetical protein
MTRHVGLRLTAVAILAFAPMMASANERPGPKGSVGGGAGTGGGSAGKGGVPQMQTPMDPMQQGTESDTSPQPGSGKGTQNPKQGNAKDGGTPSKDKATEKKK